MQNLDPDLTTNMPKQLPSDFFIPDADYDAAVQGIGGGGGERAQGINADSLDSSSPSFLAKVDSILKSSNLPASAVNDVRAAVEKELGRVSADVAALVIS